MKTSFHINLLKILHQLCMPHKSRGVIKDNELVSHIIVGKQVTGKLNNFKLKISSSNVYSAIYRLF